jgi:hypothetical protein
MSRTCAMTVGDAVGHDHERMRRKRGSWAGDALAGAVAGGLATWVMDLATTGLMQQQPGEVTEREKSVRPNGRSSVGNLVARLESSLGLELSDEARGRLATGIHYALGIVPGSLYGVASRRLPRLRAGAGLLYGTALWAVNDEWANSALGLAAPIASYPLETHWRGLVGHAVLGVMTEAGVSTVRP